MNNSVEIQSSAEKESANSSFIDGKALYKSLIKDEKFLQKYYGNSLYIRNSNPYLSDEEKRFEEAKMNKEKWITRKNFLSCAKIKPSYISNYVNLSMYKSPYKDFRDVKKDKWLGKRNFLL